MLTTDLPVRFLIAVIGVMALVLALVWQGNSVPAPDATSLRTVQEVEAPSVVEVTDQSTAIGASTSTPSPATSSPAAAPASTPQAPVAGTPESPPTLGMQFHGTWDDYYQGTSAEPNAMFGAHLDQLAAHGVKLLRVDAGWSSSQPRAGTPDLASSYNQRIKRVLDEAGNRGMKVMLTLWRSPEWARPTSGGTNQFPTDPGTIAPWATWMAKTFGHQVAAWQIWNEPNISEFTGIQDPNERAGKYVPVLKAASQGIKAGDSDAVVVFGGPAQNDDAFIRQAYELGAKNYFDIMSVHPYQGNQTREPEPADPGEKYYTTHFATVAEVMKEFGDGTKPVWWTEFGYSVHSNDNVPSDMMWRYGVATQQQSGDYLARTFELARKRYPQVKAAFVYTAYRQGDDPYGHESGYSMLNPDGTPRQQLTMLRDYMNKFTPATP